MKRLERRTGRDVPSPHGRMTPGASKPLAGWQRLTSWKGPCSQGGLGEPRGILALSSTGAVALDAAWERLSRLDITAGRSSREMCCLFGQSVGGGDDVDGRVGGQHPDQLCAHSPLAPRNEREPSGKSIVPCARLGNDG